MFRITFAKILFCAGDVKYFSIFFQFICRFIYKSLFLQKHTTLILYTEYGEWRFFIIVFLYIVMYVCFL